MPTNRIIGLIAIACIGCGKESAPAKTAADSTAAAAPNMPGMASMPGMDMAKSSGPAALAPDVTLSAQQIEHGAIKWAPAKLESAASTATVPGALAPNEDRTARLGAPARGRVVEVRVQPGDRVEVGQILVTLQSSDAGMAQSDASKANAEVTSRRAQSQYAASARARAERLLALKAIPRQDYERALADDEQARAALSQAEAEQRRAQSAAEQLGATSSGSGEIALRASRAGVVLTRAALPGTVVEAGTPLITITDPSTLWLTVNAPEQFAPLFRLGDQLHFTVPAFPGETFVVRIDAVSPGLDKDTRTLAVRGVTASTGKLKAEMLASVTVDGGPKVAAVLLPEDAVQLLEGKPTVFLMHALSGGGARFERRQVEVGARSNGRIAVIKGIAAGDLVVTAGAFAVKAVFQKAAMPKMEM